MTDQSETWRGGCLCGAVTYESNASPVKKNSGYCHCRMCQKAYGNGFTAFIGFPAESFRITRGEPTIYRSSNVGERGFCARCGSPLIMRYTSLPESVWVYVGTMDRAREMERYMDSHVCIESEIPWLTIHDDL
ncbi:MAG: GFA family protein, partial [Gemmatimonadetes bacterium]|nr:GFA family protein [Gemmatimonadota bacterium]